ncbi:hypothetical protein BN11_220010 [Nostocoides australiense Ben110]|uniref:Succinylglutamate desuccinylase/Aspartoacylase catalytic domain-containing protein n=1 Tax=Nostocoides australiense Ben110 TaxID=1193182 RepID=W6JUC5_9MICO|nr:hypothetical protein BN11_220010 [Tetrasphaera australiensis Ben110]
MPVRESFPIGGVRARAGSARELSLPITRMVTGAEVSVPVRIVHGREDGPLVWLTAATHGDEVVGVEVIREVLAGVSPKTLRGTVVAVPIVNVLGFMAGDRYLPDRRDLNRSFPGSARGSLASRIAHLLMSEVIRPGSVGIDLHTGAFGRTNLPQIRCDLDDESTRRLALAFGAPVAFHAKLRDGSVRFAARERRHSAVVRRRRGLAPRRLGGVRRRPRGAPGARRPGHDRPAGTRCAGTGSGVPLQRMGAGPAYRDPPARRRPRLARHRRRAARRPRRLLRQDRAAGAHRPRRHRHRPRPDPARQPRGRPRAHRPVALPGPRNLRWQSVIQSAQRARPADWTTLS